MPEEDHHGRADDRLTEADRRWNGVEESRNAERGVEHTIDYSKCKHKDPRCAGSGSFTSAAALRRLAEKSSSNEEEGTYRKNNVSHSNEVRYTNLD